MLVNPCILCLQTDYEPVTDGCTGRFINGKIRCCTDCLVKDIYENKIRKLYKPPCLGACFTQNNNGTYDQGFCTENCKLIKCSKCDNHMPLWVSYTRGGLCGSCYGIIPYIGTFLNVPYERKEEAKQLGAKWDKEHKKWFVEKDNKNYKTILSRFK